MERGKEAPLGLLVFPLWFSFVLVSVSVESDQSWGVFDMRLKFKVYMGDESDWLSPF